jgi:hypothetical protein
MSEDKSKKGEIQQALDKLVAQFIQHPDVTLIDAGYSQEDDPQQRKLVLRIHVRDYHRDSDPAKAYPFPTSVDNIPVIVVPGDFHPELTPPQK